MTRRRLFTFDLRNDLERLKFWRETCFVSMYYVLCIVFVDLAFVSSECNWNWKSQPFVCSDIGIHNKSTFKFRWEREEKRKHLVCSSSLIILCFVSCLLSCNWQEQEQKGFYHKNKMWWNAWVHKQDVESMMMSDMSETTSAEATDVMRLQSCRKSSSRITCRESEWFL